MALILLITNLLAICNPFFHTVCQISSCLLQQTDYLEKVSKYVSNNYKELRKFGLSEKEAMQVFSEGDKLLAKYDKNNLDMSFDKSEFKTIQKESNQQIEMLREQNISIT